MTKRYYSIFKDIDEAEYTVEIWQDGDYEAAEIRLGATPVEIEWTTRGKLEPIYSSKATIYLLSESDRYFADLYTSTVRSVRLDIYKNGALYWSGTIDTELYEEPYDTEDGYEVSVTFSDFSIWKRLSYDGSGFRTIGDMVSEAVSFSGISYNAIRWELSTALPDSTSAIQDGLTAISDNFYDEDGEADSIEDVVSYILEPLGAFILQRDGDIIITDINTVYGTESSEVRWKATGSSMEADKVYNKAIITLSAYEEPELLDAEVSSDELPKPGTSDGVMVYVDNSTDKISGFRIQFKSDVDNEAFVLNTATGAKYFAIRSIYSGNDERGIAYSCKPLSTQYAATMVSGKNCNTKLFSIKNKPYIGVSSDKKDYNLKISLEMMFDVRYNPFESSNKNNEEGNWDRLQNWCNFGYVPVKITLRDVNGNALYHYKNSKTMESSAYYLTESWLSGEATWGEAYLCYYDLSNRKSSSGFGGWSVNRPIIGYFQGTLPAIFSKKGEGEFLSMPPCAGWLDIEVGVGVYQFDYKREEKDIYSRIRWCLYKNLNVTITDKYGIDIETTDHVLTAWVDKQAEDEYELETHLGTIDNQSPMARGLYFDTSTKAAISEMTRMGITESCEKLLAGTIYSQYGSRRNKLVGKVGILDGYNSRSEKNHDGVFLEVGTIKYLRDATEDITMVEIVQDNYEGVEYND